MPIPGGVYDLGEMWHLGTGVMVILQCWGNGWIPSPCPSINVSDPAALLGHPQGLQKCPSRAEVLDPGPWHRLWAVWASGESEVLARESSGLECLGVCLRYLPEPFEFIGAALSSFGGFTGRSIHTPIPWARETGEPIWCCIHITIAVKMRFPLKDQNSCVLLSFRIPYRTALILWVPVGVDKSLVL